MLAVFKVWEVCFLDGRLIDKAFNLRMGYYSMKKLFVIFTFIALFVAVAGANSGDVHVVVIEDKTMKSLANFATLDVGIEKERIFSSVDGFYASVNENELAALRRDPSKKVFVDEASYHTTLDVSAPQIGANNSWELIDSGINLTGRGQTVCIIDTGVNYSHAALGGCYGNNNASSNCTIIGGYDFVNDDDDPMDDNGHGTHVSGIVASTDSTYKGISFNSKIVMIKALDFNGDGYGGNIAAGIDWCVANASKFNISVISMSLGDNSTYNSYCNSNYFAGFINAAVAAGISVVVSAGNCDQIGQSSCTTGVSIPACVESATRVGAVNDNDEVGGTADFMRGDLFELFAPGVGIISTVIEGGFNSKSGTSMAAPHISGAIAIIRQYLQLSGQSKTPGEIDLILNNTGKIVDDSLGSGNNFSRINVYSSLLSLDVDSPNVTLVSPDDNHIDLTNNQSFLCNATDWQLSNVTFKIWNSSGLYYNESRNLTGVENGSVFNLNGLALGKYYWDCLVFDKLGNFANSSSNFTLNIASIEVSLDSPSNESFANLNRSNFSCSVKSDASYDLVNLTFRIWNSSGDMVSNSYFNISGASNFSNFSYTFLSEGPYSWGCFAYNNNSDKSSSDNFSITYDVSAPVISGLSSNPSTDSAVVSWNTDEGSNSSIWVSGGASNNLSDYSTSHSITISSLSSSTSYDYVVTSCDRAKNCASDSGSFVTDAVVTSSSGGGGGGGGGGSNHKVISVNSQEFWKGKSAALLAKDKFVFSLTSGSHSLEVDKVGKDWASFILKSDPIELNLSLGEEIKINLSSDKYYDLVIKLEGVNRNRANVSVKRIFEEIGKNIIAVEDNKTGSEDDVYHITEEKNSFNWIWVILACVGVVGLIWIFNKKDKPEKKVIKKALKHSRAAHKILKKDARRQKLKRSKSNKKHGKN